MHHLGALQIWKINQSIIQIVILFEIKQQHQHYNTIVFFNAITNKLVILNAHHKKKQKKRKHMLLEGNNLTQSKNLPLVRSEHDLDHVANKLEPMRGVVAALRA